MQDQLELIIDEWRADAGFARDSKFTVASSHIHNAKYKLRRNVNTAEIMGLVKNAGSVERAEVLEFVSMLGTPSGRAQLIEKLGAKHESDAAVVDHGAEDDTKQSADDDTGHKCSAVDLNAPSGSTACVPSPGTAVILKGLEDASSTQFNGEHGIIIGYNAEVDRYVIKLNRLRMHVRVRRGNMMLAEASVFDLIHSCYGTNIAAKAVVQRLATRHGDAQVSKLIKELMQLPQREWSVERDLRLIDNVWWARTQPHVSMHTCAAPPAAKIGRTDSPKSQERRRDELRKQLPPALAQEFLALSAAAAPIPDAAVSGKAGEALLLLGYDAPTLIPTSERGAPALPYGCLLIANLSFYATGTYVVSTPALVVGLKNLASQT